MTIIMAQKWQQELFTARTHNFSDGTCPLQPPHSFTPFSIMINLLLCVPVETRDRPKKK